MIPAPLISVVIPTFNRPHLVCRAVRSALNQSFDAIEVIVVVDSRDEETKETLTLLDDPRLKIIMPYRHLGNADARNAGIREARGEWVALLDDDDVWLPEKLKFQLEAAKHSLYRYPIVSCRLIARTETTQFVWPRRYPRPNEPLSEYLFCRSSPFTGEGMVQTSTILTKKCLLEAVPFASGLRKNVDLDWLLKVDTFPGTGVIFVPEPTPLVIWHIEEQRERITMTTDWQYSLSWIQQNHQHVTRRAYASFVLTLVSAMAARQGDGRALLFLAWEAYRYGRPRMIDLVTHVSHFLLPHSVKQWAAAVFASSRNAG
jgi:glycosyltransferase involved in cell wall biosynthesis